MVRAILEGRKTQTRRIVKPQPKLQISRYGGEFYSEYGYRSPADGPIMGQKIRCPYGV